jgi:hypothetical protein
MTLQSNSSQLIPTSPLAFCSSFYVVLRFVFVMRVHVFTAACLSRHLSSCQPGVSASEQRCVGWNHSAFGSPLSAVHTRAATSVVSSSGGVCVGFRGHTVWRSTVLHASAPVTALCSEVMKLAAVAIVLQCSNGAPALTSSSGPSCPFGLRCGVSLRCACVR